jgi:hypothetical protein
MPQAPNRRASHHEARTHAPQTGIPPWEVNGW